MVRLNGTAEALRAAGAFTTLGARASAGAVANERSERLSLAGRRLAMGNSSADHQGRYPDGVAMRCRPWRTIGRPAPPPT